MRQGNVPASVSAIDCFLSLVKLPSFRKPGLFYGVGADKVPSISAFSPSGIMAISA